MYEVIYMAKQGMNRIERTHVKPRNEAPPVPEIQGKAKCGKVSAKPIVEGTKAPAQKVYHGRPHAEEKTISKAYAAIDTDLARDNLENDLPAAEIEDL